MHEQTKTDAERKAEQYTEEHLKLMRLWAEKHKTSGYDSFISDGIINPLVWYKEKTRILFLLKEAYNKEQNDCNSWDLTTYLSDKKLKGGKLWNTVALWQYGIENTTAECLPKYDKWLGLSEHTSIAYNEKRAELLNKCAVVNIKKSNGQNHSNDIDLMYYAKQDYQLLKRQIEIINPTIIVCGNTFHLLHNISETMADEKNEVFGCEIDALSNFKGCYSLGNRILLSYYHPSNQYPAILNFYGIVALYQQYLKNIEKVIGININRFNLF